jgi:hypothetical protein
MSSKNIECLIFDLHTFGDYANTTLINLELHNEKLQKITDIMRVNLNKLSNLSNVLK